MANEHKPAVKKPTADEQPAFPRFSQITFSFFKDLANHRHRDWFATHKHIYDEQVLAPMAALVDDLGDALRLRGIPLQDIAKAAIFRIYRD